MDEDPDTVLAIQYCCRSRELRSNFPLVFKAYKDIGINEELAAASFSTSSTYAWRRILIRLGRLKSKALAQLSQSDRSVQAGKLSRGDAANSVSAFGGRRNTPRNRSCRDRHLFGGFSREWAGPRTERP